MHTFRKRTIHEIADMICGNESDFFQYRSSSYLTQFFEECDMENYVHDGSTRKWWVSDAINEILSQSTDNPALPSFGFQTVIQVLMDRADQAEKDPMREHALSELNATLAREGLEAFYAQDNRCYIRNTNTGAEGRPGPIVDRALSQDELHRRARLETFMENASEDDLTEKVILPLLQTLGFQRISVSGHKDKAMEFGSDLWMKYRLPTGHMLYFGVQVKRGKLDATARTRNENIAAIHNQLTMMLGHTIFDPDINRKRLIDHAIIVAGGEITKHARHWLGQRLDATQRSQILFMDRPELLHLFIVHNVTMPEEEHRNPPDPDIPF